jgi:hypothetical protein
MRIDEMFGDCKIDGIDNDIDNEIDRIELMGYDFEEMESPELMGRLFGRLIARLRKRRKKGGIIRRIVKRVRARRKARAKAKKGKTRGDDFGLSLTTPEGTATFGPGGISFEDRAAMIKQGMVPPEEGAGGIMAQITKNPMLLAIPAGLFLMMIMKKKRPQIIPQK